MSEPTPTSRRGRLLRIGAACAVLLALAGYLLVHFTSGGPGAPRCTVRGPGQDGDPYEMQPEQALNAATIEAVGSSRGLPERAITIALATAMQESGLRNIDYGDRDSVGLFQQRPSQGWGETRQIMDPVYSAGKFYEHLEKIPGYSRLPLTEAAQRVQRSGFPQAYAKHEPEAVLLASALTGRTPGALSCTAGSGGKQGDPEQVRAKLIREFGPGVLPAAQAGELTGGGRTGKAYPASDAVVAVPVGAAAEAGAGEDPGGRRGWEVAHWAVAHASELGIAQVSYAGRVWSAAESGNGWRKADGNSDAEKSEDSGAVLINTAQ
ncbi:hypothetical protein AB0C51_07980 [Streptomyces pathocidini]|uniref:ARB-07466-like C-terminal domain-containing protein n=1 Tax=Streptomyces pathocidini TaxID=1650571 RepID=A0ABW7UT88_9ACTN|nr:hypothetical protein [Streptomyces pathocidini]